MGLVWGVERWVIIVIILLFLLTPGAMLSILYALSALISSDLMRQLFIFFYLCGWKLRLSKRREFAPSHTAKCRKKINSSITGRGRGGGAGQSESQKEQSTVHKPGSSRGQWGLGVAGGILIKASSSPRLPLGSDSEPSGFLARARFLAIEPGGEGMGWGSGFPSLEHHVPTGPLPSHTHISFNPDNP